MKRGILLLLAFLAISLANAQAVGNTFVDGIYNYKVTSLSPNQVTLTGTTTGVTLAGAVVINSTATNPLYPAAPYNVTEIGLSAFMSYTLITSVSLPEGLLTISTQAFRGTTALTTINIPSTVTSIGMLVSGTSQGSVFRDSGITSLVIPDNVVNLGPSTFYQATASASKLISVTLPSNLTSIPNRTFYNCKFMTTCKISSAAYIENAAFQGCTGLKDLYLGAATPPTIDPLGAFSSVPVTTAKVHIPSGSLAAYSVATTWSTFTNYVEEGSTLWNGTNWSYVTPNSAIDAVIDGNFGTSLDFEAQKLTVKSGATFTINSGTKATITNEILNDAGANGIVVKSGGNLVQTNNVTNTGDITVERAGASLKKLDYTLWSSPTGTNQKLNEFSPDTFTGRFYIYNPITDKYAITADATPFETGKGYLIRMPNSWSETIASSWTGSFVGIPNNGNIDVTVTENGYNAIGNPYPSAINADIFIAGNSITGPLYLWRKTNNTFVGSAYATYTLAGGVTNDSGITPTKWIQPGQGFIVNSTAATIKFTNEMRANADDIVVSTGTSDGSWTGTSFALPNGYTHTAGTATALTHTFLPVIGQTYEINYVLPGFSSPTPAGNVTISFGGTTFYPQSVSTAMSTRVIYVKATTNSPLTITCTSTFNGKIAILSIKNSTAAAGSFLKTKAIAQPGRVWLNLSQGNDMVNQMLVAYMDGATVGVDKGIDGKYINDAATALTSNIDGGEYVIQGRPAFDASDVVALNFKSENGGSFTIAKDHADGLFEEGQNIYLADALTGVKTNLQNEAYTFTAAPGTDNTRFSLIYQSTLGVNTQNNKDSNVKIYRNNGIISVSSSANAINNIKVFDIQGRLLAEQKNVNATTATIKNLKASNQVVIVKVTSDDHTVVTKKVLN